jgi:hypothetical protein
MTPPVVGIDPGAATTGVVARHGDTVHYAATVRRDGNLRDYITEIGDTIDKATHALACHTHDNPIRTPLIAVEDLNEPTPHLGLTNLKGLIGTAKILGAILHRHPAAIVVPPGRHGSAPLTTYPPVLIGPRERAGTGTRRHARSAYDVAGYAARIGAHA